MCLRPAGLTVLLYFLGHLLEKFVQGDAEALYILEMRNIWFVPFVNPDGYVANQGLRSKARSVEEHTVLPVVSSMRSGDSKESKANLQICCERRS